MDMYDFVYDKDFLKNKTVKVKTVLGRQCVEITDTDKTFRYLSNTIDMERLNKVLKDIKDQETKSTLGEENDKPKASSQKKKPMSFEETMYDKDISAKTDEAIKCKTVYIGGAENMGDSLATYISKVKSFLNTNFCISNIECKYILPKDKKHMAVSEYIEAVKAMDTSNVIVLNQYADFEKNICEELGLSYIYIPEEA